MRTTITLDDDVANKIRQKIRESHKPAKVLYNELLRAALTEKKPPGKKKPFELPVFKGRDGLMPGFSWDMTTAQILDKLDEEEFKARNETS